MIRVTVICMTCAQTFSREMEGPLEFMKGRIVQTIPLNFPLPKCPDCSLSIDADHTLYGETTLRVSRIEEAPEPTPYNELKAWDYFDSKEPPPDLAQLQRELEQSQAQYEAAENQRIEIEERMKDWTIFTPFNNEQIRVIALAFRTLSFSPNLGINLKDKGKSVVRDLAGKLIAEIKKRGLSGKEADNART